jgi:NAD(P)-dependent dehydrogenase (short-subunit alcohol dehydrogenase family)
MAATTATVDAADYERVIDVNLHGVWRTLRATLPHVIERRGYLLPIASIAAVAPIPLFTAYGMSKAAVESLAMGLRMELANTGTAVGVAYFGVVDTDLVRGGFAQPAAARMKDMLGPAGRAIPVSRAGAAIVRGIERRSKRVYAPRWVPALLATRGVAGPSHELLSRRPEFVEAVRIGTR